MTKANGVRIAVMIAIPVCVLVIGWVAFNAQALHAHEMAFGHVGMEERVKHIEEDLSEVKEDVKSVLRKLEESP